MIQELSSRVAKWLEQEGAISGKDKGLFSYAVYSLLFGLLPIFIVIILGLAFGMLREGLLMITPFMLIRKFSGGYHISSLGTCIIFSTIILAVALSTVKVIINLAATSLLTVLVLLCVLILFIFSPIENNARKMSENEKKTFRKISQILACATLVIYLLALVAMPENYFVPIGVGILLVAFLMMPCIPAKWLFSKKDQGILK